MGRISWMLFHTGTKTQTELEVQEVSIMATWCLCLTIINVCCYEATYLIRLQKQHLYGCLCAMLFIRSLQSAACICSIVSASVYAVWG